MNRQMISNEDQMDGWKEAPVVDRAFTTIVDNVTNVIDNSSKVMSDNEMRDLVTTKFDSVNVLYQLASKDRIKLVSRLHRFFQIKRD